MPELLRVITFEADGATSFHKENADKIFSKIPPNKPVAVLGISGNSRQGKSFALSALVVGMQDSEVLKNPETVFGGPDGVPFQKGNDPHTKGILIWSEPFEIKTNNEQEITVIIMDTQGTFDLENNKVVAVKTFAIANLLCSMLVFNKMKMMDKNDLDALDLFVKFGQWLKENKGQHLVWLLRDFNGEKEGGLNPKYLRDIRNNTKSSEITESLMEMDEAFGNFSCFTLTTPEKALQEASGQIKSSACGAEFIQGVVNFVDFIKNNIESKKMQGKDMFGSDLRRYLEEIVNSVQKGDLPEIGTAVQAMEKATLASAELESKALFESLMQKVPKSGITPVELKNFMIEAMKKAVEKFNFVARFCPAEKRAQREQELCKQVQEQIRQACEALEHQLAEKAEREKDLRTMEKLHAQQIELMTLQNKHELDSKEQEYRNRELEKQLEVANEKAREAKKKAEAAEAEAKAKARGGNDGKCCIC